MTREEAIKGLETLSKYFSGYKPNEEMFKMAVSALKAQGATDTNVGSNGDTIYRQAAMSLAKDICVPTKDGSVYRHRCIDPDDILELPSAQPEPCEDAVSRKLMYELGATCIARRDENGELVALGRLDMLPSAQPEIKPIEYRDCANAMLKMWMDNVVTDGEYNRIMDKLNAHWGMKNE